MVQLWVNLPAKDKMSAPKYQAIENKQIPIFDLGENGKIEVIAGEYQGLKGAASTFTPVNLLNAKLNKDGKATFSFPANYNTALLVLEGSVVVNGNEQVALDNFVLFENNGESIDIQANEQAVVLLMSGEPIGEPIASHGPFVMNHHLELVQAFDDFNQGKFGYLED